MSSAIWRPFCLGLNMMHTDNIDKTDSDTCRVLFHYSDTMMGTMASASPLFTHPFIQAQIKENIKAPRHWPLWGEFTGDRWIPHTNGR